MFAEGLYRYDCSFRAVRVVARRLYLSMSDTVHYAVADKLANHESRQAVILENRYGIVDVKPGVFSKRGDFPVVRHDCYVVVCCLKNYSRVQSVTCT